LAALVTRVSTLRFGRPLAPVVSSARSVVSRSRSTAAIWSEVKGGAVSRGAVGVPDVSGAGITA
jgi:hypothetical protein